jgi:TRAP-type C4-dicarboxylate transport system permease small subunit
VLEKKMSNLFAAFKILSGVSIVGMMVIVTVDATMRKFVGKAIHGSYDMVSYLLSIFVFTSFIVCQLSKAHFRIDILTTKFPFKTRAWIYSIGFTFSVGICFLMAYQLFEYGLRLIDIGATAMELTFVPTYPFAWIGSLCFAFLGLQFFFQAIKHLENAVTGN